MQKFAFNIYYLYPFVAIYFFTGKSCFITGESTTYNLINSQSCKKLFSVSLQHALFMVSFIWHCFLDLITATAAAADRSAWSGYRNQSGRDYGKLPTATLCHQLVSSQTQVMMKNLSIVAVHSVPTINKG